LLTVIRIIVKSLPNQHSFFSAPYNRIIAVIFVYTKNKSKSFESQYIRNFSINE